MFWEIVKFFTGWDFLIYRWGYSLQESTVCRIRYDGNGDPYFIHYGEILRPKKVKAERIVPLTFSTVSHETGKQ